MKFKIIRTLDFSSKKSINHYLPPLGMPGLYAHLKDIGFDVSQTDLNTESIQQRTKKHNQKTILRLCSDKDRLFQYLKGAHDESFEAIVLDYLNITGGGVELEGVDVLLLSLPEENYCSMMLSILIARHFKSNLKNKIVVFGGAVGEELELTLKDFNVYNKIGLVDYYMLCSDLESSLKLARRINGENIPLGEIHGLLYREGDRCLMVERKKEMVLARTDFTGISLQNYAWDGTKFFHQMMPNRFPDEGIVMLPFRMILGCPYRCAFCFSSLGNQGVSHLDPVEAVRRLKILSETHHTKYFFFLHDMINVSEKFIHDFCDEIIRTGLKIFWTDCASVRNFRSPEIFVKMRKAGACRIFFGMETASRRMLKSIDKKITPEQIQQVIKWSHDAGIWTGLMLIAGLPHEQNKNIRETADFIQANAKYIDVISLSAFHLAPNSLMFSQPEHYGITNVRRFEARSLKDKECALMNWAFDEIGGLSWEKKLQQIKSSYQTINEVMYKAGFIQECRLLESMNVLFYLYTYLEDKDKIKKFYSIYRNHHIK